MPEQVIINEVGPRDGLQSQSRILGVEQRLALIRALEQTGLARIEAGSFVSPKAVPAMADTDQLLSRLDTGQSLRHSFLIPNRKGFELALAAGAKSVTMVVYASETMAQKNARMTQAQAEAVARQIIAQAKHQQVEVILIIAVSFACPFDGATAEEVVLQMAARFADTPIARLVLADTIGAANPAQVQSLLQRLTRQFAAKRLGCHFHDTRGMALANIHAALQAGVRWFDSSIGGLGGCPFAPGASGNVATEDVAVMLQQMGLETGLDCRRLLAASDLATALTGTAPGGRAREWLRGALQKNQSTLPEEDCQ